MYRMFAAATVLLLAAPVFASAQATPANHSIKNPATVPAQAQQPGNQQPTQKAAKKTDAPPTEVEIREAQQALSKAGLYKGQVTGKSNAEFQTGLKKFQTQHKLKATGHLDHATMEALKKVA